MTAGAGRDRLVAGGEPLAVYAGRVFGLLVDALPWRKLAHQLRVAVTARARLDLVGAARDPAKPERSIVRGCRPRGQCVAAMTIDACKRAVAMNVLRRERPRRSDQPVDGQ